MSYRQAKSAVASLLATKPELGAARLPSAADDYLRISSAVRPEIEALTAAVEESPQHNQLYRTALLRLASIECAAGAPRTRCREWFSCLASLASWAPPGSDAPIDLVEAVSWLPLSGESIPPNWPSDLPTARTSSRVLYRLVTRQPLAMTSPRELFENAAWEDLCNAVEGFHPEQASRAFREIADWWLSEYRDSEVPVYDPDSYPTFEPEPNAALALVLERERMDITFEAPDHQAFYYAGRMFGPEKQEKPR